jgi:hypothetical protein
VEGIPVAGQRQRIINNKKPENPSQKRRGPKASYEIRGPLDPIFYPPNKATAILDFLEIQFWEHDLCGCNHRRHVEIPVEGPIGVQSLFALIVRSL